TITIDLELESLSKFDLGNGTVNAELVVEVHCDQAPCDPQLALGNGKETAKREKIGETPTSKKFRMKAELDTFVDLSEYPYDSHAITIELYSDKDPFQTKLKTGQLVM